MSFFKDLSLSAATAGFVAVLVGFTSSVAIVFQAAQAFGATPAQITSWMWALGLGMGLCTVIPSLVLRQPVMVAWSTPGAAVLASAGLAGGFSMAEAIGAFLMCGALITLAGATGWFERVMNRIPMAIAAALLAGVLARFGLQAFGGGTSRTLLRELKERFFARPAPDAGTLRQALAILLETDLRTELPRLRLPVLLLHGNRDTLAPAAASRWMAQQFPQAQLHVIEGASHAPFLSHPETFMYTVRTFLKTNPAETVA